MDGHTERNLIFFKFCGGLKVSLLNCAVNLTFARFELHHLGEFTLK